MRWRDIRLRVRALLAPDRELGEELSFHQEMETRQLVAAGMRPDEARSLAKARFGSVAVAAEECRDARGTVLVETCLQDITYAVRGVRRAPVVALTIVVTVALGLGLVAAVFTIFSAFVFRRDVVHDPDALFGVERVADGSSATRRFTLAQYDALRRDTDVLSNAFAALH